MSSLKINLMLPTTLRVPLDSILGAAHRDERLTDSESRVEKLFLNYVEAVKKCLPDINSLKERRITNITHSFQPLKFIFLGYVDERVSFLLKNAPQETKIEREWDQIKLKMATTAYMHTTTDLAKVLKKFLGSLERKFKEIDIDNSEFNKKIEPFYEFFQYLGIPDTPLISFFEEKLHSQNFDYPDFKSIDFPISAHYQALKHMIDQLRLNLAWVEKMLAAYRQKYAKDIEKIEKTHNKLTKDYIALAEFKNNVWDRLPNVIEKFAHCIGHLKNLDDLIEHFPKYKAFDQECKAFLATRRLDPYDGNLMSNKHAIIEDTSLMVCAIEDYLINNLSNIRFLSSSLLTAWVSLKHFYSENETEQKEYMRAQIILDEYYPSKQQAILDVEPVAVPHKRKRVKKDKQRIEKENTPPLQPQETGRPYKKLQSIEKPLQVEKDLPITQPNPTQDLFTDLSLGFLNYARAMLFSTNEKEALIHASWHFAKCQTIYNSLLEKGCAPEDRLNFLTTFVSAASLGLEQTYRFKLLNQGDVTILGRDVRAHDLSDLHHRAYPEDQKSPEAISSLRLGILWSRFFYEENYDWRTYRNAQGEEMPHLLQNFVRLAINPESFNSERFLHYCQQLTKEVAEVMPSIAPFGTQHHTIHSVPQKIEDRIFFDVAPISFLANRAKQLVHKAQHLNETKAHLMLAQSLSSLMMLERTLHCLEHADNFDEFSLWVTRSVFIVQETTDLALHALDYLKKGRTRRSSHNIGKLAQLTNLDLVTLSAHLDGLALKLKYPVSTECASLGGEIIDQAESLRLYPELDFGFEIAKSAQVPEWKLPLKASRKSIAESLTTLIADMHEAFENEIFPALEDNLGKGTC